MKVFLGGTCANSTWRQELIPMLEEAGIEYFNPVVKDWTEECMEEELHQRETCDIVMYCVTPEMEGVYSIAEVVDDSNKRPEKTLFVVLKTRGELSFTSGQMKSLRAVATLVHKNGGVSRESLEDALINLTWRTDDD